MTFKLSDKSLKKLEGVHDDLQKVVKEAIKISRVDFGVLEGFRTPERQKELYDQGRTKPGNIVTWTLKSDHLWGLAVDLGAYSGGVYNPGDTPEELRLYDQIANAMLETAARLDIPLVHGIFYKGKLTDTGHFALNRNFYKR